MSEQKQDPEQFRIDNFKWLCEQARKRHQSRRDVAWKVSIGVWTALLAAAGAVFLSESDDLPRWSVVFAAGFAVVVIGVTIVFEIWVERMQLRESRLSYWYSSKIEIDAKASPPPYLLPGHKRDEPWHRFVDGQEGEVAKLTEPETSLSTTLVDLRAFKIYVTILLASLFFVSVRIQTDWPRFGRRDITWAIVSIIIGLLGFAIGKYVGRRPQQKKEPSSSSSS